MSCGAAARTRVAAAPGWRGPIVLLLVIAVLCLGVLAAALVKLAHGSGPRPPSFTRTITTTAASAAGTGSAGASGTP